MSLQEIQELRRRLEEERRLREEEQRLREQAEDHLRLQTQQTTLPEFLDACHAHLFLGLSIQKNKDSLTKGDPANANQFATERYFTPLLALKEYGKEAWERMTLYANPRLREVFYLNGDITFENHANTLTDESSVVAEMGSLSLSQRQPRRSVRLAAKSSKVGPFTQPPRRVQTATQQRTARPRADQFCIYNKGPEGKAPAFIVKYKAPHKVSLAYIRVGLQDMDLDDILRLQERESTEDICRRTMVAIITQVFSYMIPAGVESGLVYTSQVYIYLRIPEDDPSTVLYYLSVLEEDVGPNIGWTGDLKSDNRLHLTAVGQLLAFTLRALRMPVQDITWTIWAASKLQTWEMIYNDLLEEIEEKDIPSSDFKLSTRSRLEYCRAFPVKTRSRLSSHDDAGDETRLLNPSTSSPLLITQKSQGSRSKGKSRQYYTQKYLLSLIRGGELDRKCPNVSAHGLSSNILQPNTKLGCESLHIHGRHRALFKITLWSHGYTFVGKGAPVEFVDRMKNEEFVYSRLIPIQGTFVPVLLSSLRLRRPFSYDGIVEMVHLMYIGFAGRTLARQHALDRQEIIQRAEISLQAIYNLGVLHSDPIPGNMAWNERDRCVMFIDFERSMVQNQCRMPLGIISSNQKRKRVLGNLEMSPNKRPNCFERETRRMINGL
ncbi:hypothetical protein BDV59DRAFT_211992 [Aspergillus ambiguus]|uniref:uncharacterized protein n=1 Tax=Aspergillus ambiguus TaxID=176160 RepID=UPI003CCCC1B5